MHHLATRSLLALSLLACGGSATTQTATPQTSEERPLVTDAAATEPVAPQTGSVEAAVTSPHRSEANRARDRYRHPKETLAFFGLKPEMTVVELAPGRGWYSEILAALLSPNGQLIAAVPPRYQQAFDEFVAQHPLYKSIHTVVLDTEKPIKLAKPSSVDMVVTFRNTHNWIQSGHEEAVYTAAFKALRPGGVLGVVQHRAKEGADVEQSAQSGYVPQAHVVALAEQVGFKLEEASEINANPADTTDHPEGVWTLPPVLRLGDQDRATYQAIGESDRMTLRFRKPGASNATDSVVL